MKLVYLIVLSLLPISAFAMDQAELPTYYELEKTANENDDYQAMFAEESLFIQLVVQASKSKQENKKPFQELLQRIGKEVKIEEGHTYVGMTKKDGMHRLLSYIPCVEWDTYVNGKKIDLEFIQRSYFTVGKGGKHSGMKSEDTFSVTYNFTSDKEHHAKVVAEYNALLAVRVN